MHIVQSASSTKSPTGYSPSQIKAAYGLPSSGGAGTTIAIIDAYNTPTIWNDLSVFSNQFNLPIPILGNNFEIYTMSANHWIQTMVGHRKLVWMLSGLMLLLQTLKYCWLRLSLTHSNDLLSAVDYARNQSRCGCYFNELGRS